MPDFWISNGFVMIYDGNMLMRAEHTAHMGEGSKIEDCQSRL